MNFEESNENNDNDKSEDIEDNNNKIIVINDEEQRMYITEDKYETYGQENTDIVSEEDDILINYEENLITIEENEEEDDSLNDNIESTGCVDQKNSKSEERVSSYSRSIIKHSGSGLERLEIIFDGKSYSHNTRRQFMMIKEKYNVNEDIVII